MEAGHWPVVNRKSHCGANQSKSRINSAFESSLWIFSEFLSILILWLRESQFYDSQIFIFLNQKNFSRLDLLNAQERQKRQILATKINADGSGNGRVAKERHSKKFLGKTFHSKIFEHLDVLWSCWRSF